MRIPKLPTQSFFLSQTLSIILLMFSIMSCNPKDSSRKMGSVKGQPSTANIGSIKENRSAISAQLIEVIEMTEERFYLVVKVLESNLVEGFENFAQSGDTVNLYPNYVRLEGQTEIDFYQEINQQLLNAKDLMPGTQLNATISKMRTQNNWLFYEWFK